MADLNVGQAIALQTRATPYEGSPITTGLRLRESNALREAEIEARRQAAEQKRRDMLSKFTTVKPVSGIHPAFTKQNLELAKEANFILTDPNVTPAEKAQLKSDIAGEMILKANYGKQLNDFGTYVKNRQNLSYRGLSDFLNISNPEELKTKAEKYNSEDRMILDGAYGFDETGLPYVQTPLKRQNVSDVFTKALSKATGLSDYDVLNKTENFTRIKQSLGPQEIDNILENLVIDDPNLAYQLRFDNEKLTKEFIREEKKNNPLLNDEEIMLNVDQRLAREVGRKYYLDKYGIRSNSKMHINIGSGLDYGDVFGRGDGNQTIIKRQTAVPDGLGGFTYKISDFKVNTGAPQGFKVITTFNARADDMINLNTNQSLAGQPLQKLEVGQAKPYPVATRRMKDKLGRIVEPGQVVDAEIEPSMIENGAVQYIPMFEGRAEIKRGTRTVTVPVVVPTQKLDRAVLISQSKDDVPATTKSIQNAIDEAAEMNKKLQKSKVRSNGSKQANSSTDNKSTPKFPLPAGNPRRGKKGGVWYVWDENTGTYIAE